MALSPEQIFCAALRGHKSSKWNQPEALQAMDDANLFNTKELRSSNEEGNSIAKYTKLSTRPSVGSFQHPHRLLANVPHINSLLPNC